jgi:DNA polymerase III delta prime subunit
MVNSSLNPSNIDPSQDWGYKFVGRAVDDFIRAIEGDAALEQYSDYRDRRQHAENLMQELFAQTPHLFYVRRKGEGQNQDEEKWELTVATDLDNIELPPKLRDLAKTLQFITVISKNDYLACLRIIAVRLLHIRGRSDVFSQAFRLRLLSNYQHKIGVPQTAIEQMAFAPSKQDYLPTAQQLEAWSAYVNIEERKARERQFSVSFVSHNYGRATRNISFAVEPQSVNNGSVSRSLNLDDFWKRAERAINNKIKISSQLNSDGRELGEIVSADREQNFIRIHLNSETVDDIERGEYILPMGGILSFEPSGNITEIRRKREALEKLAAGQAINPYLGKFLFNASEARTTQEFIKIDSADLLLKSINPSQKLAVEQVISAPDLALIQGPPGTGKTTVIAEICYQVARLGGRTLIASQANLAVDNALSCLKHNPIIRAVRKGNRDSVSIEGKPFLEDKVVGTWLSHTATDCQHRLDEKRKTVTIINLLLESSERFDTYLSIEEKFESLQEQLQDQIVFRQNHINFSRQRLQSLTPSIDLEHLDYAVIFETIERRLIEIDRWSSTADRQINETLQRCLQNSQYCRVEMIELPAYLQAIADENQNISWRKPLQNCLSKFNRLVERYQQRNQIYSIMIESRAIRVLVSRRDIFGSEDIVEKVLISLISNKARFKHSDPITVMEILHQDVKKSIDNLRELDSSSDRIAIIRLIIEIARELGYSLKLLRKPSQHTIAIATHIYFEKKVCDIIVTTRSEVYDRFRYLLDSDNNSAIEATYLEACNRFLSLDAANIDTDIESISRDCIRHVVAYTKDWLNQIKTSAKAIKDDRDILNSVHLQLSNQLLEREDYRSWWTEYWQNIPDRFKPETSRSDLFNLEFLNQCRSKFNDWRAEIQDIQNYLNRHESIISDWVTRITDTSEQNRHELRKIYLDNANVIGITCSQSAQKYFAQEFKEFDVVIIDEVSKCTPPELLIPALKAKKLVLVGDHRQLPPMIENSTVAEIAEELNSNPEELRYLKESLFRSLFESASNGTKTMLSIQYRMHPDIMMAINQFYEDRLECGLKNPDLDRAHHLGNSVIQDNHHIAWVQMPRSLEFKEQRVGTSFINTQEVQVIERLCQQFEQKWASQVRQGKPRKELGIITFYGSQLRLIEQTIDPDRFPFLHIRTGTVDRFQGMEKQVIIVSMVRNNDREDIGFAKSPERVNVAFSRAQELLIIVGCHSLFTRSPIYSNVSDVVRLNGDLIDVSALI